MAGSSPSHPVSATQWIFGAEGLSTTAERLSRLGYDGIELGGEPAQYDPEKVAGELSERALTVTSICGIYTPERDLSHPTSSVRQAAVAYVTDTVGLATEVGAPILIVVPTAVGRVQPEATAKEEWRWAVESIREAATVAEEAGVTLVLESLNRYESYLVNRLERAADLVSEIGRPNVGLMADLFHMNIEEASIPDAILGAGALLRHVHLADSNRRAPGLGHTDFAAALEALDQIDYRGAYTMEFLPPTANPYIAASLDVPEAEKTASAEQAIGHLRRLRPAEFLSS